MADPDDPLRRAFERLDQLRGEIISAAILVESSTTWMLECCLFANGYHSRGHDDAARDRVTAVLVDPMSQSQRIQALRAALRRIGLDPTAPHIKATLKRLDRANELRNQAAQAAHHYSWNPATDDGPQDSRFRRVEKRRGAQRQVDLTPEALEADRDYIEDTVAHCRDLLDQIRTHLMP